MMNKNKKDLVKRERERETKKGGNFREEKKEPAGYIFWPSFIYRYGGTSILNNLSKILATFNAAVTRDCATS